MVELTAEATVDLDLRVRKSDAPFVGDEIHIYEARIFNESFVRAGTVAELQVELEAIYRDGELRVVQVPQHVIGF